MQAKLLYYINLDRKIQYISCTIFCALRAGRSDSILTVGYFHTAGKSAIFLTYG